MKSFWEKFSVTKLVLLLLVLTLMFIEIWNVIRGGDISDLFANVVIAVISFYFGQKGIQYEETDSLVKDTDERTEIIGYDLQNNKEEEDGGDN